MAEEATSTGSAATGIQEPAPQSAATGGAVDAKAEKPAAKVAPEKYDLKFPEKTYLDKSHLEEISSYAKEHKLSNEEAQRVLDRDHGVLGKYAEQQQQAEKAVYDSWLETIKKDKDVGGEAFKESCTISRRALDKYGSPELMKLLDHGLGNNPHLFRFLVQIGRAMAPDTIVKPGAQTGGEKSNAEVFYGAKTGT